MLRGNSLDVEGVKVLLFLNRARNVSDDLLEVAGHRVVKLLLMLDLKIVENPVIDLALVPSPLIVIKMLNWQWLKERVVVSCDNTAHDSAKDAKGEGSGKAGQLRSSLLRGGAPKITELFCVIVTEIDLSSG